jgi:hypothetical protein
MPAAVNSRTKSDQELPSALELLEVVLSAFDIRREALEPARCILGDRTARRGFKGTCRTRRWCCRLTAALGEFERQGLLELPFWYVSDLPTERRLFLFIAAGVEMVRWEELLRAGPASGRAHLRFLATDLALRLAPLLASSPFLLGSPMLASPPAWADAERRGEMLQALYARVSPRVPYDELAARILCSRNSLTAWLKHGKRPMPNNIDVLARFLAGAGLGEQSSIRTTLRWHYGLAEIADRVAAALGRPFTLELAAVFAEAITCSVQQLRNGIDAGEVPPGLAAVMLVRSARHFEFLEEAAAHVERHGASPDWREDLLAAHSAWQRLPKGSEDEARGDLLALCRSLPRREGKPRLGKSLGAPRLRPRKPIARRSSSS